MYKIVNWPAVLKHANDPELIYIRDQAAWENDDELHHVIYNEADFLVDSSGLIFTLTTHEKNRAKPEQRGETMSLHDLLGLVKAHAAQKGSCCVAKLYAPTIKDALDIVASLDEL